MLYFAYAPEHDIRTLLRWARARSKPTIEWTLHGPALLRDADLIFRAYDPITGGGYAAAHPTTSRRIAGVVYEIHNRSASTLDDFSRSTYVDSYGDAAGDSRILRRTAGHATRTGDGALFDVFYFAAPQNDGRHVPPTPDYIRDLASFSMRLGHSHAWLMHLMTIPTTAGQPEPILYDI